MESKWIIVQYIANTKSSLNSRHKHLAPCIVVSYKVFSIRMTMVVGRWASRVASRHHTTLLAKHATPRNRATQCPTSTLCIASPAAVPLCHGNTPTTIYPACHVDISKWPQQLWWRGHRGLIKCFHTGETNDKAVLIHSRMAVVRGLLSSPVFVPSLSIN